MSSHDLLVLWTQLAALLLAARLLGALANRMGQPAVAGELAAGLLLGPSAFGHLWPAGFDWLFPRSGGSPALQALVSVSLAGLLLSIGAETDLPLIRRLGAQAAWVTGASLAVPLAAGAGAAVVLEGGLGGQALRGGRGGAPFVVLIAGAAAVSSLPVLAKIVSDLGLVRRNLGQIAIAAGTVHDAAGFVLVALATGLAGSGGGSRVAVALIGVAGVSALLLTAGQRVFDAVLRAVRRDGPSVTGSLAVCVIGSLAAAAAMQAFGVEGSLGAFVAGVVLGRSRFQVGRAVSVLDSMTATVFAPLYFAAAGLKVDLGVLARGRVAVAFFALVGVAALSKFAGAAVGARLARLHPREVVSLGVLLNGRGALQVVMATAGLGVGVLTTSSYTVVILLSVVTSLAVAPVLRLSLGGWRGTPEEQERLGREEQLQRNVVVRDKRLLLASRGSVSSIVAAEILAAAWPPETPVSVVSIEGEPEADQPLRPAVQAILDVLADRPLEHRRVRSADVAEEILAEAKLGYGAIVLGAGEDAPGEHLLSPVLDQLIISSPLPLIIVRRPRAARGRLPAAFAKVLVPVSGTPSSRAGQEVACNLSAALGSRVVLAHVVTRTDGGLRDTDRAGAVVPVTARSGGRSGLRRASLPVPSAPSRRDLDAAEGAAQVVLRAAWETAVEMGVEPDVVMGRGGSAGDGILAAALDCSADVIAVGATVRQVDGRPFLGHTVEQVLARSDSTVVVVALPDHSAQLGSALADAAG